MLLHIKSTISSLSHAHKWIDHLFGMHISIYSARPTYINNLNELIINYLLKTMLMKFQVYGNTIRIRIAWF